MATLHHIGCSGGKDSTALVLWAIHESGLPRESLRVTFCDTGNEDRLTYEHLDLIRRTVVEPAGIVGGLETLKPERNFFELALHKRRFPSRKAQFCTQHLKLFPTQDWVRARQNEGHDVVMLNGKRTGESEQRKAAMAGKPERLGLRRVGAADEVDDSGRGGDSPALRRSAESVVRNGSAPSRLFSVHQLWQDRSAYGGEVPP